VKSTGGIVKLSFNIFVGALISTLIASSAFASKGLVINAAEFGVGKFHRYDNTVHVYQATNAWTPYVLPNNVATDKPYIQKNPDGSFTVFFSTLDELLASITQISHQQNSPVSVINLHGHGLPGAMWFPKDAQALNSMFCMDWVSAANGDDKGNYEQYYAPMTYSNIMQVRSMADNADVHMPCTTGADEWTSEVAKNPDFLKALAPDVQVHLLSCVVGLGSMGENLTKTLAALLSPSGQGRVETSMDFGLGDWSMPAGMGFWDYKDNAQLDRDDNLYVEHHQDSEIAQKGTIRMVTSASGQWKSTLLSNKDFMSLAFETSVTGTVVQETYSQIMSVKSFDAWIQVPGTKAFVHATNND
jgi:hypothetical protein